MGPRKSFAARALFGGPLVGEPLRKPIRHATSLSKFAAPVLSIGTIPCLTGGKSARAPGVIGPVDLGQSDFFFGP